MSRKDAREMAMRLLFQKAFTEEIDLERLRDMDESLSIDQKDLEYVHSVLEGFALHQQEIDGIISKYAKGWSLDRIWRVDLAILRLAIYEILYREDIPASVSINEGVELAKRYGTEKSSSFVNGILGRFVKDLQSQEKDSGQ